MLDRYSAEVSRNDQLGIVIRAGVEQGVDAAGQIVVIAQAFGLNCGHVGAMPKMGRHRRNDKGRLTLID